MSVATDSPQILSEGVLIRSYIAHTDGLKDATPMRAGECRHYSSVAGVATGLKLIGPDRGNYRDWVLEGVFEMAHAATGEKHGRLACSTGTENFSSLSGTCLRPEKRSGFRTISMSRDGR